MSATGNVVVKLFAKDSVNNRTAASKLNQVKKAIEAEIDRLKSLGLDKQASIFRADRLAPVVSASYEELSPLDTQVWREFMPKAYSKQAGDWKEYHFDTIPEKVISAIAAAEETGYFDDMEIWTPDKVQTDAYLMGVIDDKRFPIARWGERLHDFDEIAIRLAATHTHWASLSKLARPVQQFIVDRYLKNPENEFYVGNGILTWHCMTPTQKVIVCPERRMRGIAYFVCKKCGSSTDGKHYDFSYDNF